MDLDECHCSVGVLKPKVELHAHGKCVEKSYPYQPLPSSTSIRLLSLSLLPDVASHRCMDDLFSPIECSLTTIDLEDNPAYTALSYTWGDPNSYYLDEDDIISKNDWYCQCYTIRIDGHEVTVSANLYAALVSIRYIKSTTNRYSGHDDIPAHLEYIWIDALCINQLNLAEKSKQVLLMRQIYSQSQHVLVWLGGEDTIGNTAIQLLAQLERKCRETRDPDGNYPSLKFLREKRLDDPDFYEILNLNGTGTHISIQQWSSIFAFLNRSWFRRAWVIQELVFAEKANFVCGLTVFSRGFISNSMIFLSEIYVLAKLEELEDLIVAGKQLSDAQIQRRGDWPSPPSAYTLYKTQEVNKWNSDIFLSTQVVRDTLKISTSSKDVMAARRDPYPLSLCMLLFRSTEATDPRDKIYAFLGLSYHPTHQTNIPSIIPDYSLSPRQIYIQAAEFMIQTDKHLYLLSLVEDPALRKIKDLPSWVPDFSTDCHPLPFQGRYPSPFCADRGLGQMHAVFPEPGILEVLGFRLNKISATAKVADLESGGMRTIAEFLSGLPRVIMTKKPIEVGTALVQEPPTTDVDITQYTPQSRLEVFWRTILTDRLRDQHPAPDACGSAYRISCHRYLSHLGSKTVVGLKTVEDFSNKWQNFLDENEALRDIMLPGEMKSLNESIAEGEAAASSSNSAQLVMLDSGDFDESLPEEWRDLSKSKPWSEDLEGIFLHEKGIRQRNRKLAIITPGALALVPESAAEEDEIWIISGSKVPFILRPLGRNRYKLIGEAYLHGIMHGEGMEGIDIRYLGIRHILLV